MMKNNRGLIVIIVILSMLVLGLGGYLVHDKVINNDTENESTGKTNEKMNQNESLDVDSEIVKSLVDVIRKYSVGYRDFISYSETTDEAILEQTISNGTKNMIIYYYSNLSEEFLDSSDTSIENGTLINDDGISILKNKFEELFGYDGFIAEGSGCPTIKNINDKYYAIGGCGIDGIYTTGIYVTSAEKVEDDILIEAKVVFVTYDSDDINKLVFSTNQYDIQNSDENQLNKLDESSYKDITSEDAEDYNTFYQLLNDYAKNNQDSLETYIYRFKKHNDNYYLYSVQKSDE